MSTNRSRWILTAALASVLVAPSLAVQPRQARAATSTSVSVSFFYDDLAPYGRWVSYPAYGWCWEPTYVSAGWRPYWDGQWVYTEYGWTWVSDEPWSWAAYHYGRWFYDPALGWLWVPGSTWAPAWVAWGWGDDCVGWAPLPPEATWSAWGGVRFAAVERVPASSWCFVRERDLGGGNLRPRIFPVSRNRDLLVRSRDATRFATRDGRAVNQGPDVDVLDRKGMRRVPRMRVVDTSAPARGREMRGGGEVRFYRPDVRDVGRRTPPPPAVRGRDRDRDRGPKRDRDQEHGRGHGGVGDAGWMSGSQPAAAAPPAQRWERQPASPPSPSSQRDGRSPMPSGAPRWQKRAPDPAPAQKSGDQGKNAKGKGKSDERKGKGGGKPGDQ